MNRTFVRVGRFAVIGAVMTGCAADAADDDVDLERSDAPVINGTVDNGDPAVVMLRSSQGGYCTGTLASPTVVVTAAHCVDGVTVRSVGFGVNGQSTPVTVRAQIAHPRWNGSALNAGYDVAVLLLQNSVSGVIPVPVSTDVREGRPGDAVRIVGYGNNQTTGSGFGTKRQASIRVVAPARSDGGVSQDKFVKVWDPNTGTQTCNGDSGGPVFYRGADGRERIVGVTSYGYEGCRGGALHTRVAFYREFLDDYLSLAGNPSPSNDNVAPSVRLVSPANNSTLRTGLQALVFEATDNVAVSDVTLTWAYNDTAVSCANPPSGWTCSVSGARYTFTANIGTGVRRFAARAADAAGNVGQTGALAIQLR